MKFKIMVMDSSESILDIMEVILNRAGYHFIPSINGHTPEEISRLKPDLIMIEDRLEGQSAGRVISSRLKLSPLTGSIPIIIMTTLVPIGNLLKEAMADAVLAKPFDLIDLETIVKVFLK